MTDRSSFDDSDPFRPLSAKIGRKQYSTGGSELWESHQRMASSKAAQAAARRIAEKAALTRAKVGRKP